MELARVRVGRSGGTWFEWFGSVQVLHRACYRVVVALQVAGENGWVGEGEVRNFWGRKEEVVEISLGLCAREYVQNG
jgi:hypothetical protein